MAHVSDCEITKVYEGKSGEGEYGPWTAWNFYVDKSDLKFSYFSGGKKPKPVEGMRLELIRYDTVTKGEYTNHNVKEIFVDASTPKPSQKPSASTGGTISPKRDSDIGPMTMWGKYIGEVVCSLIGQGLVGSELDSAAHDAMETFVDCCVIFEKTYSNVNDDYPPIGEPPPL